MKPISRGTGVGRHAQKPEIKRGPLHACEASRRLHYAVASQTHR